MKSKRVTKHNSIQYQPLHVFNFGGGFAQGLGSFKLDATSLGKGLGQQAGALGSMAGGIAGGLLSNGLQSQAGSVLNTIGDLGSMVPGPWGAVIGGGAKIAGGLVNAAFGTKVNQEKLNAANQGTNYLNSFVSNASSFDDIRGPQTQAAVEDAYKGGWFSSKKARRKNAELRRKRREAQQWADRSVENNIENLIEDQMSSALANYAAFGGPLDFGLFPIGGAIDYELAQRRLTQKELDKKALGGPLHSNGADWTNGVVIIDSGGSHEQNPFEGVPMGIAPDGQPNLVEEGEVIFNDYVFSNRIKVPKDVRDKYKLRGNDEMTFADAAKKVQKASEERPNDPIAQRSLEEAMSRLMGEQEAIREKKANKGRKFATGGWKPIDMASVTFPALAFNEVKPLDIPKIKMTDQDIATINKGITPEVVGSPSTTKLNPLANLRYIPAIGGAISVFSDLMGWTNTPDYSNADLILNTANGISDVKYTPIGDYLTYNPLDRLFYANQLGAQAGATRRAIMNTSGGNRGTAMAGLLAADYNAQGQLGNLFRQAEEYNAGQRERIATFNRGTNMFNAENALKAAIASRDNAKVKVNAAAQAAAIRDAVDSRVGAARSANLTNLFDSLGDIGREAFTMDMIKNNPALYYDWMGRYKGATKARGGFLTIKKRRR